MDIQQALTAQASKSKAAAESLKKTSVRTEEDGEKDETSASVKTAKFSQMLQELQQQGDALPDALEAALAQSGLQDGSVLQQALQPLVVQMQGALQQTADDVAALASEGLADEKLAAHLSNLQTLLESGRQPAQDGVEEGTAQNPAEQLLAQRMFHHRAQQSLGKNMLTDGQLVANVAAGVQSLEGNEPVVSIQGSAATGAAVGVLEAAVEQTNVSQRVVEDASTEQEGRLVLQGGWKLEDQQSQVINPALQKVMGQIEQWAAATSVRSSQNESRSDDRANAHAQAAVAAGMDSGSGTRLTDNAVREVQQADSANLSKETEAPVEYMRFWLQGKQQRAEVLMDRDGQPVRVTVSLNGNTAHVTFQTDGAQTRAMLDDSMAQLRAMLQEQGVELAGVSVQAQGAGEQSSQEQASGQQTFSSGARHAQIQVEAPAASGRSTRANGLDIYA